MLNLTDIYNGTNSTSDAKRLPSSPQFLGTEIILWISVTITLCAFGALTNLTILVMIKWNAKLRTGSGFLIGHLVMTYLILCCVSLPINCAIFLTHYSGQSATGTCHFALLLIPPVVQAGNWTDACLAVNRVVAIWFPQQYKKMASRPFIIGMVGGAWALALVYMLPRFAAVGGVVGFSPIGTCTFIGNGSYKALYSFLTVLLYAPYAILGVGSAAVLVRMMLVKIRKNKSVVQESDETGITRRRMGAAKMLLVSFLWCCFCYSPTPIITNFFMGIVAKNPTITLWLFTALSAQGAFNPLIFFAMSEDYRRAFGKLVKRRRNLVEPQRQVRANVSAGNYETRYPANQSQSD